MIRYHFPLRLIAPRVPSFVLGRRRSLSADVTAAFQALGAAPQVRGRGYIPLQDAFLLVMNHYHRADIPSWWMSMAVIQAIAERRAGHAPNELRMVVASQWTYPVGLRRLIAEPFSRFLVGRIITAYDFLPMVPPELGPAAMIRRAGTLRAIVLAARAAEDNRTLIGLAPEGGDTDGGVMVRPPVGAGRFMQLLCTAGPPFLPAGVWAEGDQLFVRFGEPFHVVEQAGVRKSERDEFYMREVMGRVAALVPPPLRGPFGES
jgi:1-acyl-sn-glycerol-3-phosphate acyltransferase